jgi:hypothetical protein
MILATHGIIGSGAAFDADADAFFNRVTTAGGTLSMTEKQAVNTLVVNMKAAGIWSAMKAVYPMVGASAAACAQNLKSSSFTGTFSSGWTFASTGVTPNGTSAFFNTTLNSFTDLTQTSLSFGVYYRTNADANTNDGTYDGNGLGVSPRITTTYMSSGSYANLQVLTDTSLGLKTVCKNGTAAVGYLNGISSVTATDSATCPSLPMFIGALNLNGSPAIYNTTSNSFIFIGNGLTNTNMSNYYTAIQAFQTTLSRNV